MKVIAKLKGVIYFYLVYISELLTHM